MSSKYPYEQLRDSIFLCFCFYGNSHQILRNLFSLCCADRQDAAGGILLESSVLLVLAGSKAGVAAEW